MKTMKTLKKKRNKTRNQPQKLQREELKSELAPEVKSNLEADENIKETTFNRSNLKHYFPVRAKEGRISNFSSKTLFGGKNENLNKAKPGISIKSKGIKKQRHSEGKLKLIGKKKNGPIDKFLDKGPQPSLLNMEEYTPQLIAESHNIDKEVKYRPNFATRSLDNCKIISKDL